MNVKQIASIVAVIVGMTTLGGVGVKGYQHFAKTSEVIALQLRFDKNDLRAVQGQIFELEREKEKRRLTPIEQRRLNDLKQQEQDILRQIQQRGR